MVQNKTFRLLKTLYGFREKQPTNRPYYFLDFPIVGPKKSWCKLKLWVSKPIRKTNTKPMKQEWAQSEIPVKKKSQKPSENTTFLKYAFIGWFLEFFSSLICRIELILVSLVLYFFLIGLDTHYLGFTSTFFFGPTMGKSKKKIGRLGFFFTKTI